MEGLKNIGAVFAIGFLAWLSFFVWEIVAYLMENPAVNIIAISAIQ